MLDCVLLHEAGGTQGWAGGGRDRPGGGGVGGIGGAWWLSLGRGVGGVGLGKARRDHRACRGWAGEEAIVCYVSLFVFSQEYVNMLL